MQIFAAIGIALIVIYLVAIRNEPKWGIGTAIVSGLIWWLAGHLAQ